MAGIHFIDDIVLCGIHLDAHHIGSQYLILDVLKDVPANTILTIQSTAR